MSKEPDLLKVPKALDKEAAAHWKKHAPHAIDNGSLTEATSDSFQLVCRLWSILSSTDPHTDSKASMKFIGVYKHYCATAKLFGMLGSKSPAGKKKASLAEILAEKMNAQKS